MPTSHLGRRLESKTAVVTGGSRGIGFAIARVLAVEGCRVIITGRDADRLEQSKAELNHTAATSRPVTEVIGDVGNSEALVAAISCDVRNPQSVDALFAEVRHCFGRLDILVNNAGIAQPPLPIEETSLRMWANQLDTNLTGTFLCTRAALPLMKPGATIINNISAAAKQTFPNFAAYTAAKAGALGFTLSLRNELMPRGIRVTALMPGATSTDLWNQIMPDARRDRMIDPDSVAQAVLYAVLLPPEANLSELLLSPTGGAV